MSYTLLQATNAVLKRVKVISGVSGELASLTDSPRQTYIDTAVQVWNEAVHELYSRVEMPMPRELKTDSIVLVEDLREYDLPADLESLRFPLVDQTNGNFILAYAGGYEQMRIDQLQPGNWTGQPYYAVTNPENGLLRMDRIPTSAEDGKTYELAYDRRIKLDEATSTFPFSDTVVDSLVPVVAEFWKREQRNTFDEGAANLHFGRAARYLSQRPMRRKW